MNKLAIAKGYYKKKYSKFKNKNALSNLLTKKHFYFIKKYINNVTISLILCLNVHLVFVIRIFNFLFKYTFNSSFFKGFGFILNVLNFISQYSKDLSNDSF
jgi:hypothetical protein